MHTDTGARGQAVLIDRSDQGSPDISIETTGEARGVKSYHYYQRRPFPTGEILNIRTCDYDEASQFLGVVSVSCLSEMNVGSIRKQLGRVCDD